ncbi:MAG: hypothetical protein U0183_02490 [Polyangiaceae bacterium]
MRSSLFLGFFAATAFLVSTSWADVDRDGARRAYDRGVKAYAKHDAATAAREFALADELAPSPVALRAALDAAIEADDPVLGSELVERAGRAPSPPELSASVEKAKRAFSKRVGRVVLHCGEGRACDGTVDGAPLVPGKPRIVRVGDHQVRLRSGATEESSRVTVAGDELVEVHLSAAAGLPPVAPKPAEPATPAPASPPAPAPAPPPAPPSASVPAPATKTVSAPAPSNAEPSRKPLPRGVVAIGGGLTVVAGAVAIASAVDVSGKHGDFVSLGCATVVSNDCTTLASSGKSAETRTNIMLGVTGGLAVVTAVVAFTLVDWGGPESGKAITLAPTGGPGQGGIRLSGAF